MTGSPFSGSPFRGAVPTFLRKSSSPGRPGRIHRLTTPRAGNWPPCSSKTSGSSGHRLIRRPGRRGRKLIFLERPEESRAFPKRRKCLAFCFLEEPGESPARARSERVLTSREAEGSAQEEILFVLIRKRKKIDMYRGKNQDHSLNRPTPDFDDRPSLMASYYFTTPMSGPALPDPAWFFSRPYLFKSARSMDTSLVQRSMVHEVS